MIVASPVLETCAPALPPTLPELVAVALPTTDSTIISPPTLPELVPAALPCAVAPNSLATLPVLMAVAVPNELDATKSEGNVPEFVQVVSLPTVVHCACAAPPGNNNAANAKAKKKM